MAESLDLDQMPHCMLSDLSLHCLLRPVCLNTYSKYGTQRLILTQIVNNNDTDILTQIVNNSDTDILTQVVNNSDTDSQAGLDRWCLHTV